MNCRQTRDLLSAYLDQELTGQQMLEIHAHLGACVACAEACREVREVRRLLRSLVPHFPGEAGERRLMARLDREARLEAEPFSWAGLRALRWPALSWEALARDSGRPRGRRLASALALSSVAVLAVANPVAPPTQDAVGRGVIPQAARSQPISASWIALPADWSGSFFASFRSPSATSAPVQTVAQQYVRPAAQDMDTEPFRDESVSSYAQLADYRSVAFGGR